MSNPPKTVAQAIAEEDLKPPFIHHCLTDEQAQHVQSFGIPVDSSHPSWCYIASLMRESAMPTDAELRMIRSYIEYTVKNTYNLTYQEKAFRDCPFPIVGGHNTKVFRKGSMWTNQPNATEGWVYRRMSWDSGFWPQWPAPRVELIEILDSVHLWDLDDPSSLNPKWVEWKKNHPDIFPAV